MSFITGLGDIADKYDGFIFDQYGVLHNGSYVLPGALDCIERLYALGKKMVILSNSSGRASVALQKLAKIGLKPEHFQGGAVTSGELAYSHLREKEGHKKCLWLSWDTSKDSSVSHYFDGITNIDFVGNQRLDEADFVFLQGTETLFSGAPEVENVSFHLDGVVSAYDVLLNRCAERRMPLLCANPDYVIVTPEGQKRFMPGLVARRYAEHLDILAPGLAAELITLFGKPGQAAFDDAKNRLSDLGCTRICHVGDSLEHDIVGAAAAGVDVVFITSGIHEQDIFERGPALVADKSSTFGDCPKDSKRHRVDVEAASILRAVSSLSSERNVPTPTYVSTACAF